MPRVLFIETELRNEKLGIMYLSAALKRAGHETMLCWIEREDVRATIASFRPDFLALSLVTGSHKVLLALAAELKAEFGLPVVAGGPHATFFTEGVTPDSADFVVIGQGEGAIVDIVEGRVTNRLVRYGLADLESLPFPDREIFYRFPEFRDNPMKNVITCRDCPYSCSYCYNHTWKGKFKGEQHFLQKRSVDSVLAEIAQLKERYRLEQILFIDDNFLFERKWVEEFCARYPAAVGVPFLCSFSLNLLDEELLARLKDAGLFMVNFALESADPAVQKDVLCRGHVKNEQIIQAIALLRKYGIKTRMQNMIGLPVRESLADALNTLAFNKEHQVDDSWVSIFQPYPGTRLADYCFEHGYIADAENSYADSFFDKSCITIDHPEEIRRLQKWWYFIIRYAMSDATVKRLLSIDFDEATGNALQNLRYEFSRNYLYGLEEENPNLQHDWDGISGRYAGHPGFPRLKPLFRQYQLSNRLVDILMGSTLPEALTFEPEDCHHVN